MLKEVIIVAEDRFARRGVIAIHQDCRGQSRDFILGWAEILSKSQLWEFFF